MVVRWIILESLSAEFVVADRAITSQWLALRRTLGDYEQRVKFALQHASSLPPQFFDPSVLRHQHHAGHPDKQSVLDDSRHIAKLARESRRIGNLAELAIQNVMPFIRNKYLAVGCVTSFHAGSERGNLLCDQRLREWNDLNRQRKAPEHWHLLARVGDDDQLPRGRSDDLLSQQRSAAPFGQVELRIELVSAVDGDFDVLFFIKRGERNAFGLGEIACLHRCRNAANAETCTNLLSEQAHDERRRRPRAQAHKVAIVYKSQAGTRRRFFFLIVCHAREYFSGFLEN